MNDIFARIIELLDAAEKSAALESASFGFPDDRIKIEIAHLGGDKRVGRVGESLHPTEYIRRATALHHGSWVIGPIREAKELLRLHRELISDVALLSKLAKGPELYELARLAEKISEGLRAGQRA